ncbi:MAG: GH3 auxin-responsive promoter family protein [Acidisphaera sp.]|nr:GH3 auxin-responsive promoter family protein [Acidisphaera sp.]
MFDAGSLLRAYARRRSRQLAAEDPASAQRTVLRRLVARNLATPFGRRHRFDRIRNLEDYQTAVPLRDYDAFWAEWWRPTFPHVGGITWAGSIPAFANSSGTTGGATKRIPVSRGMIRSNRRAALDVLVHHLANRPDTRVMAGQALILGGSTALERLAPGIRAGDLSGIMAAAVPWWARGRTFPPPELALIGDWGEKMRRIAGESLERRITSLSGTPSWMVLFFEQVAEQRGPGARLVNCYPELELVIHGGVGFAPYRDRFAHWLAGSGAETREVFPASEGFFAIADRRDGEGMRLVLDHGIFYEFVRPADLGAPLPDRRWIATAETGVEYALIVTTNAGLWSYVLGDTVTLVDRHPPRLLVTGRTSWSLSVVGEHLIGAELDAGVAAAASRERVTVADYVAGPVPPDAHDQRAGHLFLVELGANETADPALFAATLDGKLRELNEDYAAHRQGDVGMRPPSVHFARAGAFADWMRSRGKLGGQNKVPRVMTDAAALNALLDAVSR